MLWKKQYKQKSKPGPDFITEVDRYLFGEGTHYKIYEKLGAHPANYKGKDGYVFCCTGRPTPQCC